eukprot:4458480-Prymnesium_polylepis.1
MITIDETAKDRRAMQHVFGWSIKGHTPYVRDFFANRGKRVSALCMLSADRMEDWRFTHGTYNTRCVPGVVLCSGGGPHGCPPPPPPPPQTPSHTRTHRNFNDAVQEMLSANPAPDGGAPLITRFPCILIDNARIHHANRGEFEQWVRCACPLSFRATDCIAQPAAHVSRATTTELATGPTAASSSGFRPTASTSHHSTTVPSDGSCNFCSRTLPSTATGRLRRP